MTRSVHVIGNIQLDVVASPVETLPAPGGDDLVERMAVRPAGAAGNVSLALAALGARHRLFGAVGDDQAGLWVLDALRKQGLADDVQVFPGQATGISIALEAPGRERSFLTSHGVLASYTADHVPAGALAADLVLLTGYFTLPGMRGRGARDLLERARAGGALTLLDTGWDPDDWTGDAAQQVIELLPLVDVFLPNHAEATALTQARDPGEAASRLRERGATGWVVISLGERGVHACGPGGEQVELPAPPVVAIDTTGAGDCLAAGLLADLASGQPMPSALATAVRVASTVVGRQSETRYPGRAELVELPGG